MKTLIAVLLSLLVAGPATADAPTKIRLTNGEWAPYQSKDLPNYGAASELVTAAFNAAGIEVEYGFFPWNRAMMLVERGAWDGSFMWVLTPERDRLYLASDPLFTLREVVFYSRDNPISAQKPEDLKGKVMGALDSSAFGRQFAPFVDDNSIIVSRVPNNQQLFQMLVMGRVDFVPELETSGYEAILEHLSEQQRKRIGHLESMTYPWSYHLLISRQIDDGPYFIDAFNRGMAIIRDNGEFERIIGSYIRPREIN
ncbi:transporter substrate-binding domain-containing protein [Roseibium denhamense]|uniref:Amino acid ABC transporter substrate-binding protein, PAAT family n=1 Tax=Roseibium denhamense TaxID=76305 RepID=A0ABY1PFY1_9HYPH|nr:transporter substrate-binding domain-containing protein [Roseibium denhamense]MTI04753.1 transporter substrate-binding domain-containing protein [Roseibium denhamense]SMP33464.1 amino acid ABC transporter substrate-binding protein, PAAT family [Roseibium denhamense]